MSGHDPVSIESALPWSTVLETLLHSNDLAMRYPVPLIIDGVVVGGIGCSGATAEEDEAIATEGASALVDAAIAQN